MARPNKAATTAAMTHAENPNDSTARRAAIAHAVSLMGDAVKQYGPVEAGDVVLALAKRFEDYIDG